MQPEVYEAIPCPEGLRRYIRRYMIAECTESVDFAARAKPTGYLYLGWIFDGAISSVVDDQFMYRNRDQESFHISGQIQSHEIDLKYEGKCGHVLAEFTALGFFELTGMPAVDFTGKCLDLREVNPALAQLLEEFMALAFSHQTEESRSETRLGALQNFLSHLAEAPHDVPDYLKRAVSIMERNHGVCKISDIASDVDISMRQLNRTFFEYVGIPPKFFCRVLQMNRAVQAMMENDTQYLTELAQQSGYFDQAHFSRVINEFFSNSPQEFLERDEAMLFEFLGKSRKV